ncbi:hypothetical protein P7K49_026320 [Saguinus oedipus]|uniref:Secreted protein n=1 Tax=Saguinus oedipus TaxID=9490 RepID=A0ABQ9UCU9_SAGOE|nr:hypothetical protein P7K49_026320 [Saguinus oedipus]
MRSPAQLSLCFSVFHWEQTTLCPSRPLSNLQRCLCQKQPDAAHFPRVVDSMADPEASVRYLVYQFHPTSQMEHSQMEAIRPNWNLIIPSCPTFVANI